MSYVVREILWNLLSSLIGAIFALFIIIPFGFIGTMMTFSFGEVPTATKIFSFLILLAGTIVGAFIGGSITGRISTKSKNLFVLLTAAMLIILLVSMNNFSLSDLDLKEVIPLIIITPSALLGNYKKTKSEN